uniref:Cyclic GMP-AMP synthase n=1 Tax=Tupaia belangeri TaxID=37347 RepID=A0A1W7GKU0_TUPBE|nr:cyclic GMP-AMP synthase [Tupaia belangeri]
MDPRSSKTTPAASKAEAATPKVSARSARGAQPESSESPAAPKAARPKAGSRGRAREPGSRQNSIRGPQETPGASALGARPKKASVRAAAAEDRRGPAEGLPPSVPPEPPLPRAGSRRKGGTRSAPEQDPPPGPRKTPSPGLPVSAPRVRHREEALGVWKPQAVLERLRLSRRDISAAAEVVNSVVGHILQRLKNFDSEFKGVELLRTGSYYEHVKISAPNEFDVMFKLEVPRLQLEEYCNSGAHYFVKFKRNPKGNPLSQFLENEVLSASKMLLKFRKIIKEEMKKINDADVTLEKKERGSPAVKLCIKKHEEIFVDIILALESKSSWPASTNEGLPIQNWLGTKVRQELRRQPFYLIPKHAKEGSGFQKETWRLSFSHIEKDILKKHGQCKTCCETDGAKCCRKDCLKLMKYLLEQLKKKNQKELDKFHSYHVKTAFFHTCTENPHDEDWLPKNLNLCFDNCVTYFLKCLTKEQLEHYFIPGVNLFSRDKINKINKEFLLKQIEYQRNNGFPVFDEDDVLKKKN